MTLLTSVLLKMDTVSFLNLRCNVTFYKRNTFRGKKTTCSGRLSAPSHQTGPFFFFLNHQIHSRNFKGDLTKKFTQGGGDGTQL